MIFDIRRIYFSAGRKEKNNITLWNIKHQCWKCAIIWQMIRDKVSLRICIPLFIKTEQCYATVSLGLYSINIHRDIVVIQCQTIKCRPLNNIDLSIILIEMYNIKWYLMWVFHHTTITVLSYDVWWISKLKTWRTKVI